MANSIKDRFAAIERNLDRIEDGPAKFLCEKWETEGNEYTAPYVSLIGLIALIRSEIQEVKL